ncbi:MAG: hypothetical protein ACI81I_001055 [Arcobacteraceae bacterium]|jgi:hypothetical protein
MFETFKNKHVLVAVIVAPILAILSWYATGFIVDEKEHAMKNGSVYTLVVRPNCRWASRKCTLANSDLKIDITGKYTSYTLELAIKSHVPLSEIKIAYDKNDKPQSMVYDSKNDVWQGILDLQYKSQFINAVFVINNTVLYAQFPTTFLEPKDRVFEFEQEYEKSKQLK